jgi:AcrR family transcriptional regulator
MVDAVGEQGYAATSVASVISRAGASRRTFYEQFADRPTCFLTAAEEIGGLWSERASTAVDGALERGGNAVEAFIQALLEAASAIPAAPRLLVAELAAAGQAGIDCRARVIAELAATLERALARDAGARTKAEKGTAPTGSLMLQALVGAIIRVSYRRTLRGSGVRRLRPSTLSALVPELAQWVAAYRSGGPSEPATSVRASQLGGRAPGTLALTSGGSARRQLPRGESMLSRSFVVHNQRERLLDSIANLSAAEGYAAVTIPAIVAEAGVSVQAFYEHFSGSDDALLVAYEVGHRKALALVERAYAEQRSWRAGVSAAITTLLDFLASEPAFSHIALLDAPAAGGRVAAAARHGEAAYIQLLEPGLSLGRTRTRPPPLAAEASAAALQELCYAKTAAGRTRELPSLSELAGHLVLAPFAGAP